MDNEMKKDASFSGRSLDTHIIYLLTLPHLRELEV